MSNVIKIKHGSNPPAAGVLEEYELGYSSSNDGLYLGQGTSEPIHLNDLTDIQNQIDSIGGVEVSAAEPTNQKVLWIDTNENGAAKYYDSASSSWKNIPAVWG